MFPWPGLAPGPARVERQPPPMMVLEPERAPWIVHAAALVLTAGTSLDLVPTLPAYALPGGVFSVDSGGAPLPAGVSLAASGRLSADVGALQASAAGVVFAYTEP